MTDSMTDELRQRIAEHDRAILAAVNARLRLVAELKAHKAQTAREFVDPDQEARLLRALENENEGPLSPSGVRALFEEILALTKRELSS